MTAGSPAIARWKLIVLALAAIATAVLWLTSDATTLFRLFNDPEALQAMLQRFREFGPVAIVALMTIAVVFSPLPSAPIALAAGALYGHLWGTLYVLTGAVSGAVIAFWAARLLGRDIMERWFGEKMHMGLLGSQNALMITIMVMRLLPFVSFDLISYAAGLTAISFWRFFLATVIGIIPASFLLAHFGGEMATGDATAILTTVLILGLFTGAPFLIRYWRHRRAHPPAAGPKPPPDLP